MSGWFTFGTPKAELEPETISEALDEEDFDPIVAVRTLAECDYDSSFDCSNDVSPDSSVASQEEFYKDNGNVFGCLPSSSKSEGRKQSYVTYEVQPESFRSVAAATYPEVLNIQILEQRKPSLYPDVKATTSLQKSSRPSMTRPDDMETNELGAIEPPHMPTTEVSPVVVAARGPEVMAAMESVAKWKASSRRSVQSGAIEPPHTPKTEKKDDKLMLTLNGREQPEETNLNPVVEARQESLTSIIRRLSANRKNYVTMSDSEEESEEKESKTVKALSAFFMRELKEERQLKEKRALLTSKDDEEKSEVKTTNTSVEAMKASSASVVKNLQDMHRLKGKKMLLASNVDGEKADDKGSNTTEDVLTMASIVKELRDEELGLGEKKVSWKSSERETAKEKESKPSVESLRESIKALSTAIVKNRRDEERQLNAKEPLLTINTRDKLEEEESNPTVERSTTPTSAEANISLSLKKTTNDASFNNKDDVKAILAFYRKWKTEHGEQVTSTREATPNDEQVKSSRKKDKPVDQHCKAPLKDVPKSRKPPRERSHYLEPKIAVSIANEATRDPPSVKWLETSDSYLALSSLGTMESREDVNGDEIPVVETHFSMELSRTMKVIRTSLRDSSFASSTTSRKKVRFEEPQDCFDNGSTASYLELNYEKFSDDSLSYDSDGDVPDNSMLGDQTGCNCACGCEGDLFSGLRELVQSQ